MSVKIIVKDRGFRKIVANLSKATPGKNVSVGVLGDDEYPDGTTVAQVATWNHYGTENIPARPFISGPVESQKDQIEALRARLAKGVLEGKLSVDLALALIGRDVQSRVVKEIASGVPPPNAPSTVAQKGSSGTLRDTGQLMQSITYEVRDE